MTYGLLGKFSAQPDMRDDLVTYLLQAAKLLERNSGCIHYTVSTSDEPEAVWVCEVWTNVAAYDASLEPEDIQALIQEARPLIAGTSDQTQLTVKGGKGLPDGRVAPNVTPIASDRSPVTDRCLRPSPSPQRSTVGGCRYRRPHTLKETQ
jgi:quinol monooxygenase YgiN